MRNSNSRGTPFPIKDKPSSTTYSQNSQNRLMKTQLPPKNNAKQSLNSTQYKLPPPNTPSIKRIQSSKSTNVSSKELPKQDINFDIQNNMTESKIMMAKESLQLLKKRMNRTGMSRERIAPSGQSSHNIPPQMKTQYAPDSMKKIKSDSNKNIQNYEPVQNHNKYEQQSYEPQSYKAPSKKTMPPPQQQQKPERVLQKKTTLPPSTKNQSYYNQAEEIPIVRKETFQEILQRELRKQEAAKKMANNSNSIGNRNQKSNQPPSEYPEEGGELYECSKGCGRQFNGNAIAKHEKVCQKVFQQKRKVFNTAAQRQLEAQGFDKPPQYKNNMNQTKKQPQKPAQNKNKIPKWKLQSAQLRSGLKATSNIPLTKEEQAMNNLQKESLLQCNYCGRKFNEEAGKRHIAFCEKKAKQMHRPSNTVTKKR